MRFSAGITLLQAVAAVTLPLYSRQVASAIPSLTELATVKTSLNISTNPIIIPGGYRFAGPFNQGTISGLINGVIDGGMWAPMFYDNGTVFIGAISLYGTTNDGQSFYTSESGIGSVGGPTMDNLSDFSSFSLEIGGRYANLSSAFILGAVNITLNPNQTGNVGDIVIAMYTIGS